MTYLQTIFFMCDFLFPFWPVLILGALKGKRNLLWNVFIAWGFFALVRIFLIFNPEPSNVSFLIPEPLNTVVFFLCGIVLGGLPVRAKAVEERAALAQDRKSEHAERFCSNYHPENLRIWP